MDLVVAAMFSPHALTIEVPPGWRCCSRMASALYTSASRPASLCAASHTAFDLPGHMESLARYMSAMLIRSRLLRPAVSQDWAICFCAAAISGLGCDVSQAGPTRRPPEVVDRCTGRP